MRLGTDRGVVEESFKVGRSEREREREVLKYGGCEGGTVLS